MLTYWKQQMREVGVVESGMRFLIGCRKPEFPAQLVPTWIWKTKCEQLFFCNSDATGINAVTSPTDSLQPLVLTGVRSRLYARRRRWLWRPYTGSWADSSARRCPSPSCPAPWRSGSRWPRWCRSPLFRTWLRLILFFLPHPSLKPKRAEVGGNAAGFKYSATRKRVLEGVKLSRANPKPRERRVPLLETLPALCKLNRGSDEMIMSPIRGCEQNNRRCASLNAKLLFAQSRRCTFEKGPLSLLDSERFKFLSVLGRLNFFFFMLLCHKVPKCP